MKKLVMSGKETKEVAFEYEDIFGEMHYVLEDGEDVLKKDVSEMESLF